MDKIILHLNKYYSETISYRKEALKIADIMIDSTELVIDFTGIIFISRSFADEFFNIIESKHIKFEIINKIDDISKILDAVQTTRKKQRNIKTNTSDIITFENIEALSKFFT